jgi:large subunit ribosomal protein L23|tara:strand:- start:422709 stop:423068 length:360 start_codon:yes stop_codon:yes gene_type:complete
MAIFSTNKKTTKKAPVKARGVLAADDARLANVLKRPWFSEKALIGTEHGVYTFEVLPAATSTDIANAIEKAYGVVPAQVRLVNLPAKKVGLRGRRGEGSRARRHKAYVTLKKGDTISFA